MGEDYSVIVSITYFEHGVRYVVVVVVAASSVLNIEEYAVDSLGAENFDF